MKFLQDAALAALTSELTDARLPGGCGSRRRIINGRIEAYTTKRAGTDKRVAHELGERYRLEMESAEAAEEEYRESRERMRKMFGTGAGVPGGGGADGDGEGGILGQEGSSPPSPSPRLHGYFGKGLLSGGFNVGSGGGDRHRSPKAVRIVSNDRDRRRSSGGGSGGESASSGEEAASSSSSSKATKKSKPGGSRAGRREPGCGRRRSKSVDLPSPDKRISSGEMNLHKSGKAHGGGKPGHGGVGRRARASSFDAAAVDRARARAKSGSGSGSGSGKMSDKERRSQEKYEAKFGPRSLSHLPHHSYLCRSPLGDFHDPPARRLMTDLILTLNASFPDYDFGDARPMHFLKLGGAKQAVARINERLGEYAATSAPSRGPTLRAEDANANSPSSSRAAAAAAAAASQTSRSRSAAGADAGAFFGGDAGASSAAAAVDASYSYAHSSSIEGAGFLHRLWSAIDDAIDLGGKDTEVYSYCPPQGGGLNGGGDGDDDPLGFLYQTLAGGQRDGDDVDMGMGMGMGGCASDVNTAGAGSGAGGDEDIVPLWAFNYFFVSRSMKRIVFFACVQTMSNDEEEGNPDADEEGEGVSRGVPYSYPRAGATEGGVAAPLPLPLLDAPFGTSRRTTAMAAASSAASIGAASASGYYSVSSSAAASDVDYDLEGDRMAADVNVATPTAATAADKVQVDAAHTSTRSMEEGLARRVVST